MLLSAAIFDLDGTILTDEDEYGRAFNKVLREAGVKTKDDIPHVAGIGVKENWEKFKVDYKLSGTKSLDDLTRETQKAYLSELKTVTVRAGFEDFVNDLKEAGVKIALATSNEWWVVEEIFKKINLENLFDVVTTGEEVSYNKPDPDIFTLTAEKLGVERGECLVFEDAPSGVTAAIRAGMKVVGIAETEENRKLLSKGANLVISDFLDISPDVLSSL